jgi:ribonuclease-3
LAKRVLQPIISLFNSIGNTPEEKVFKKSIEAIIGRKPSNIEVFQLAFRHTSASRETTISGFRESNERLEYLGDAVLGMIVAEFLFTKFPYKDEGFLTEIRSRIVNRETLNQISRKLGLDHFIEFDGNRRGMSPRSSMYGDTLEAFVGAIYLDQGHHFTKQFILKKLLTHYDLDAIVQNNVNFKSLLIEWSQKEGKEIRFEIMEEKGSRHQREFIVQLLVDGEQIAIGNGFTKKKAEQSAAEKACSILELK